VVGVVAVVLAIRALRRDRPRRKADLAALGLGTLAVLVSAVVIAVTAGAVGVDLPGKPVVQGRTAAELDQVLSESAERTRARRQRAIEELEQQTRAMMAFQEPPEPVAVPQRVAFNLVPQVGAFAADGSTEEERRLVEETRRLLGAGAPRISATALHVPLFYGISQVVNVRTTRPLSAGAARDALRGARGVKVVDDPAQGVYPMPMLAVNDEAVLVGRIREDASQDRGLDLLVVADNLRRGAAATALGVAQLLLERHLASH
jgi:aspartate-semialdehyde dehydrogenase